MADSALAQVDAWRPSRCQATHFATRPPGQARRCQFGISVTIEKTGFEKGISRLYPFVMIMASADFWHLLDRLHPSIPQTQITCTPRGKPQGQWVQAEAYVADPDSDTDMRAQFL